jgi:hypothetical protein
MLIKECFEDFKQTFTSKVMRGFIYGVGLLNLLSLFYFINVNNDVIINLIVGVGIQVCCGVTLYLIGSVVDLVTYGNKYRDWVIEKEKGGKPKFNENNRNDGFIYGLGTIFWIPFIIIFSIISGAMLIYQFIKEIINPVKVIEKAIIKKNLATVLTSKYHEIRVEGGKYIKNNKPE